MFIQNVALCTVNFLVIGRRQNFVQNFRNGKLHLHSCLRVLVPIINQQSWSFFGAASSWQPALRFVLLLYEFIFFEQIKDFQFFLG
jgi:hypothetical protein